MQRLLSGRNVVLVICGAGDGRILRALDSVGLLDLPDVETFVTFNDAMECEFGLPSLRADGGTNFHTQGRRTCIYVPGSIRVV
jgi:hypothetical protein